MTKKQAIESLRSARREMKADPGLEEVDTLSVMAVAIADAWQYLTSRQAKSRKLDVAAMIADMLDGKEWSVETLDEIADVLRTAGYQVRDSAETEDSE